jgi:hypothetical protein
MAGNEDAVADNEAGQKRGRGNGSQGARRDRHDPQARGDAGRGDATGATSPQPLGLRLDPAGGADAGQEPECGACDRSEQGELDRAAEDAR